MHSQPIRHWYSETLVFVGSLLLASLSLMVGCSNYKAESVPGQLSSNEPKVSLLTATGSSQDEGEDETKMEQEVITLGSGCFWCTEAVYQQVKGVLKVESGYSGGEVENPTYQQICSGTTGHAEVVQVTYDPSVVSLTEILEIFFQTHDPTTLNRQGADVGTQYRSAIFYQTEEQKETAESIKKRLDEAGIWPGKIVTEITPFETFYVAEDYHQDYYRLNPNAGYCQAVITPKIEKFRKVFEDNLKESSDGNE